MATRLVIGCCQYSVIAAGFVVFALLRLDIGLRLGGFGRVGLARPRLATLRARHAVREVASFTSSVCELQ